MVEQKNKYHHGDLKEQLVEAVRQLIEEHGPDGFSIAQACRLAGVSTAAPYKHFKDRDDILLNVVKSAMMRMGTAMQGAADAHPPGAPERVIELGKAYVDFARREPGIFALMFGLAGDHADQDELTCMGRATYGIVTGVVSEHLGLPPDHPDVDARAYALWCAVHGHAFLMLDGKADRTKIQVSEDAYLALVGGALLPQRVDA